MRENKKIVLFLVPILVFSFLIFKIILDYYHKNENPKRNINNIEIMKNTEFDANSYIYNNNELPEWDLSVFYKSTKDEKIEQDLQKINLLVQDFILKFDNKKDVNEADFYSMIISYFEIQKKLYPISIYSYLLFSKDSQNPEILAFYSKIHEITSNYASKLNFFSLKISKIKESKINLFLKNKKILNYEPIIKDIRKYNKHRLNDDLERFSIEKSSATTYNVVKYYDQKLSKIRIDFQGETLNLSQAANLLQNPDRNIRAEISKKINLEFEKNIDDYIFIFNLILKSKDIEDKWRNFKSPEHSELIANNIDKKTLNAMITAIENHYSNTVHKYYKIKAKMLSLDKLKYYDRNAPIELVTFKYSWKEALNLIGETYNDFSPKMNEEFIWFIENNRIDAKILPNKRAGAFCTTIEPMIFLNYDFLLNGVTTLAHEIGHGIQMKLSKERYGAEMSDANLALAEVPSTFSESLIYNKILKDESSDKNLKKAVLIKKIENSINTIGRQIAFHKFEEDIHNLRKERELTKEDFSSLWRKNISYYLGGGVEIDEDILSSWPYISHFIHHPFYVHSYAFADLITHALMAVYKSNKFKNFPEMYINFFTDSSVIKYDELLKRFGLDSSSKSFWEIGIKDLEDSINQLEELV